MDQSCATCGHEATPAHRFCSACGDALGRPCLRCGFFCGLSDKYCGGCGGPVEKKTRESLESSLPDVMPPSDRIKGSSFPDLAELEKEARFFREELEMQNLMDQGEIDALFGAPPS
jgi:hypothetical protein